MIPLLILLTGSQVPAKGLETVLLKKLSTARNSIELRTAERQAEEIRTSRLACRIELIENSVPQSCYQTLALEKKFGLPPAEHTVEKLDGKCAYASRHLKSLKSWDMSALSASCRASVQKALDLLAYKLDSTPGDVERDTLRKSTAPR